MDAWCLKPLAGPPGKELALRRGGQVLGSSPEADLRVEHPSVAGLHARLTASPAGLTVEDLRSPTGTKVNGRLLEGPCTLTHAVRITFGEVGFAAEPPRSALATAGVPDAVTGDSSVLLGSATMGFLRRAGEEVAYAPGDLILRRGEHYDEFFVIISGEVELALGEGGAWHRPLARLGAGAIFGAESVLAHEGAAVDAVAVTATTLLRYPAASLPTALQESASLRRKLLGGIARHLHETTADALDLMQGAEMVARLVQGDNDPDEMIAVSARMRAVKKRIPDLAESDQPILIMGEDGTGRTLLARLVHEASPVRAGPLIAVNCQNLAPGAAAELILGDDLGGQLPVSEHHRSGGVHLAHGGTLVLRGADDLQPAVQRILAAYLTRRRGSAAVFPRPRVVLTARPGPEGSGAGSLAVALQQHFPEPVQLPPLIDRPKDILPLAESFLARHAGSPQLADDARHALLSLRYRRRNVAELREVTELAVRVAEGGEIRAEHIFGGVGEETVPGVDLTGTRALRLLLQGRTLPALRLVTLAGFVAVIVLTAGFAATALGRTANAAVWSVWEPVVFALFLLMGPVWCTVCPLSTASRWAQRVLSRDRPPPRWLMVHGPWLAAVGFALIIWVEHVFNALENPVTAGALLAVLLVLAMGMGVLYRRETWCRHLCPLGRLATAVAPAAPLQLSARPQVCASQCTTHACYRGTDTVAGCTVFHHPLEGKQAYRCKLCLDCLRSCPHGSARLQLRAPLAAVWHLDAGAADLGLFGFAVSLLALVALLPGTAPGLAAPLPFTALSAAAVAAGIGLHLLLMRRARSGEAASAVVQASAVLMILGWGALMVGQLANIPLLRDARLVLATAGLPAWLPAEVGMLPLVQVGAVVLAVILAGLTLGQVRTRTGAGGRLGWSAAVLLLLAYPSAVLALALG